jgi:integrase
LVLREGLGKDILLSAITPDILTTYASRRRAGEIPRPNRPRQGVRIANATINRELELLRAVLSRASDLWGLETPKIPWKKIVLKEPSGRQHILEREGQERLFSVLRSDFHAMVRFAVITGVRLNNVICLTWPQIKREAGYIVLQVKSKKPGGEPHYVPITKAVAAILEGERGRHPIRVFTYICQRDGSDRWSKMPQKKGERYPFSQWGWRKAWNQALVDAGLRQKKGSEDQGSFSNFRFHDLRHTAATRMLSKTGSLTNVQKLLGHQDIRSTLRYAKTYVEDVRKDMESVEDTAETHVKQAVD